MNRILNFVRKDWYVESYKVYLKLSGQREADVSCLQRHIPRALKHLHLPQNKSRFNILSIGAGDGLMDQENLKAVQKGYLNADKQVKILNTAVEPHASMVEQYKEFISKRSKENVSVEFDLKPVTFEEYAETKHDLHQYDMVQAIHSMYYVDSVESALNHCYYDELREGGGLIACFMMDSEFILRAVAEIVNMRQKSEDRKGTNFRSSADVVAVAEKNAWKFERVDCPFLIDVTGIFVLRHNSDEGNMLLDFLCFETAFRQSADQEVVASVLELLQNRSSEDEDGRLVVKAANELILIYKL